MENNNQNQETRIPFVEFARSVYADDAVVDITEDTSVPDKYKDAVEKLAAKFRDNGDIFLTAPYHHIQEALTQIDDIESLLVNACDNGDLPDGILNTLSMNIYGGLYNNLVDTDAKAVINALSVYIIISNNNNNNSKEETKMNDNTNNIDPVDVITSTTDTVEEVIDVDTTSTTKAVEKKEEVPKKLDCMGFTKGEVDSIPIRLFSFSEHDLTRHLMNKVLHCKLQAAYDRYDGIPGMPYVIMKVVIPASAAIERLEIGNGQIANMIRQDGGNVRFKSSMIKDLRPFRFPKFVSDGSILKMPKERDLMIRRGVVGPALEDLIRFSRLCYSTDGANDYVCIFLRPERIIVDMLKDKYSDKQFGEVTIESIKGGQRYSDNQTATEPIVWNVVLDCRKDPNMTGTYDVDMEAIFRNANVE